MEILNSLRFPFKVDAASGQLREEHDYDSYIKQLIRQVLLTNLGERINRPDFGCNIKSMVFDLNNPATSTFGKTIVYQALTRWLSSYIKTEAIEVLSEESTLYVSVEYTVIANGEKRFLNVELSI